MSSNPDYGKMTAVQLKKILSAGGLELDALREMLRAAWAVPNGRGESVAADIWRTVVERSSQQAGSGDSAAVGTKAPELGTADAARLALLRTTFTAEAEILAKWGMTPALPAEGRDRVASWWRTRLGRDSDAMGRSVDALERDLVLLASEAALRSAEGAS